MMRLLLLCAAFAAACSYCYALKYRVTVSEEVEVPAEVAISMGAAEVDDVAAVVPDAEVVGLRDDRRVEAEGSDHADAPVYLFAFVDLDGDGAWSDGEPWGADPNNPVTHDCAEYFAYIHIEPSP